MSRFFVVLLLLTSAAGTVPGQEEAQDPWELIRFMEGKWEGSASGRPGSGKVKRSYAFVLEGAHLQVDNTSTYPPQELNPDGEVHDDLGYYSFDRARNVLLLHQFHDETIVNRFALNPDLTESNVIVFDSESVLNFRPGWRAREKYTVISDDEFVEEFYLAPPGEAFQLFITNRLRRVQ